MEVGMQVDLKEIVLANSTFGPAEIKELTTAISTDFSNYALLRDAVAELEVREDRSPATAVRLGVCYYLMGRFERAKETLANADGGALAQFYQGKAQFVCEDYDAAQECYAAAARAGSGSVSGPGAGSCAGGIPWSGAASSRAIGVASSGAAACAATPGHLACGSSRGGKGGSFG